MIGRGLDPKYGFSDAMPVGRAGQPEQTIKTPAHPTAIRPTLPVTTTCSCARFSVISVLAAANPPTWHRFVPGRAQTQILLRLPSPLPDPVPEVFSAIHRAGGLRARGEGVRKVPVEHGPVVGKRSLISVSRQELRVVQLHLGHEAPLLGARHRLETPAPGDLKVKGCLGGDCTTMACRSQGMRACGEVSRAVLGPVFGALCFPGSPYNRDEWLRHVTIRRRLGFVDGC